MWRQLALCVFSLLTAGCQIRPDNNYVLVIRPKSEGGDYFAKYPGPYTPREEVQRPIDEVVHKRISPDAIVAYVQGKVPHSLGARFSVAGRETLVRIAETYFVAFVVDDFENPHTSDCAYWLVVLVSVDGVPVEIESNPFAACPA